MTFIAAVATGTAAVDDLRRLLERSATDRQVGWAAHEGMAVAWATGQRWVTSEDDGDVLVVLDGQLHIPPVPGRSPASLLAERYRAMGADLARGLLGDFTAIVLDRSRRTLLVCRDPLGIRPWFQSTSGPRHTAATDEATLCKLPWVDDQVDEDVTLGYLAFVSRSEGPTLHRGITTLPPGTTWRFRNGSQDVWRHHDWAIRPEPRVPWEEALERARAVLDEAVRCRIEAAGPVGSELSGGLDSSAVVGTAVRLGHPPLVGRLLFEGRSADERDYSDAVIEHWGLEALSVPPWIPTQEELDQFAADLHRPVPDANFTMFLGLHQALGAAGRTTGLTGLGGDDAFIAMPYETRVASAVQQRQWDVLGPLLRQTLRSPWHAWYETWRPTLRHLSSRGRPRPPGYVTAAAAERHGLTERFTRPPRLTGIAAIDQRAVNLTTGHTPFLFEFRAIVTDLTGQRFTHPFLDPRLITALYGLNPWFPARGGHRRALEPAAYADRLPPAVRDRRTKAEFSEVFWPQVFTEDVLRRVTTGPLTTRGWLDLDGFQNILNGAREGRAWAALPLSRAVEVDRWLRQVDG